MHWVGGQLKDVAKGSIVQPESRAWHNGTMDPGNMRVKYTMVLPGYEQVEPPSQPAGWDDDDPPAVLSTAFGYVFQWPKSQIRLGTEDQHNITPEATRPPHDEAAHQAQPDEDFEMADLDNMAQDPDDGDIDPYFGDQFVNTRFSDYYEPAPSGTHDQVAETQPAPAKPPCQVRLFRNSQETPPPAPFTEPPRPAVPMSTLKKAVGEVNAAAVPNTVKGKKKGGRRRKAKGDRGQEQIPVYRAKDGPVGEASRSKHHVAGTPMMRPSMLDVAGPHMRNLHHSCLHVEERRLRENDQSYMVYRAKVPSDVPCLVSVPPGDIFYVRHTDIFDMLNGFRLHDTLVRLFSLNMAMQIIRDNIPGIQIVDPFFMRDAFLRSEDNIALASDYLSAFMEQYSDKDVILLPYHPITAGDRTGCVLIYLDVKDSTAVYLDSNSAIRKDYSTIRRILDGALTGYVAAGGVKPRTPRLKFGAHVFRHTMQFPCVKQPPGSEKDAFYVIHHMKAFFQEQENRTLPSDLKRWAEDLAEIQDRNLRQNFFNIQEELATIVHQEVMRRGGAFSIAYTPPNKEIDAELARQGDGRSFMQMAKNRSGFINVPSKKS